MEKTATNSGVNARTSRINTAPRSQSTSRPRTNAARSTQPRPQSVIPNLSDVTDESELMNSALENKVAVVINKVSEAKLVKNTRAKRKSDTSVEPKKNKRAKNSPKQDDDFNVRNIV